MENTPEAAAAATAAATSALAAAEAAEQQRLLTEFIQQKINEGIVPAVNVAVAAEKLTQKRPKVPQPDPFYGDRKENVEQWIFLASTYLAAAGITDGPGCIILMSAYLRGPALAWWRRTASLPPAPCVAPAGSPPPC